jgi:5-methylcytosine-specific restriction protein A
MVTRQAINNAIERYNEGERPYNFRKPDWSHVVGEDDRIYPTKAIWSLATGLELKDFNTNIARAGLAKIEFVTIDVDKFDDALNASIRKSKSDSHENRLKRLKSARKKPKKTLRVTTDFIRNPDVVAEVLFRAKGSCENCKNLAPFKKLSDGEPYLEVHHKITLAEGGEDTVENAEALCPNCHREKHFG